MKIGLFFAVFTSVDAFISLEICSLQRASVKAKNRYHNDKTRKPLGSRVFGSVRTFRPVAVPMCQLTAVAAFLSSGWALMRAMKFISAVAAPLPLATALCLTPESRRQ